ncbi:Non-specific serine/threonine protein kinase protein [Dioscorea alata]|uniref:Non-specific serine/threonine protein kinase protein n=1 Tax=Dioscorea alata TaxID=55571 RepID=A0ACB7VD15_DIOAL|nr:Non-specific serine/threonine protein kinase protein [Dioscorea alata]
MAGEGSSSSLLRLLTSAFVLVFLSLVSTIPVTHSSDADVLLQFKATVSGAEEALPDWVSGSSPCVHGHSNWTGVICYANSVFGLQLENMKLSGALDLDPLEALPGLRALSFMGNDFVGLMPNLNKLGALKSLYLSRNHFSGIIPTDVFTQMKSLKKVYLSQNDFSGPIPSSLTSIPRLMDLRLDGNKFSGTIPDLKSSSVLRLVNVSNNNLEGPIPKVLSKMNPSLFAGNKDLCGTPLQVSCPIIVSPTASSQLLANSSNSNKLSAPTLVAIIGLSLVIILIAIACIKRRRKRTVAEIHMGRKQSSNIHEPHHADKLEQGFSEPKSVAMKAPKEVEHGKLVFVKEGAVRFELQDLLKASAEVLGSGNFGASYKAVLVSGHAVVVKRFKEMNRVGREDFQEHMRRLGRLSHPNLLPLQAYYYRKEEKLLVTEYYHNGSLAHLLHGTHGSNQPSLDWSTRLKIIKGVGRGLTYLYDGLPMLALPHGHLKSSNVLLDDSFEPLLTDYALVPVVNKTHAAQVMMAYKSPEFTQHCKTSKKGDVWSFGILILEILTGKFPANYLGTGKAGDDLASWVNKVMKEESSKEVFDKEMKGTKNCEQDMLKLLHIGLCCCERDEEKRWELKQAVEKIEELKVMKGEDENENEGDGDGEADSSSYASSEGEMMSSKDIIEDQFSLSKDN